MIWPQQLETKGDAETLADAIIAAGWSNRAERGPAIDPLVDQRMRQLYWAARVASSGDNDTQVINYLVDIVGLLLDQVHPSEIPDPT